MAGQNQIIDYIHYSFEDLSLDLTEYMSFSLFGVWSVNFHKQGSVHGNINKIS